MNELLNRLVEIAKHAANVVRAFLGSPLEVEYKAAGQPVTAADRTANDLICRRLEALFPEVPVIAEENVLQHPAGYRTAERIFFVDPLDGTDYFIAGTGEYTVMIGLVEAFTAKAGVIAWPRTGVVWAGEVGFGAFELGLGGQIRPIRTTVTADLASAHLVKSPTRAGREMRRTLKLLNIDSPTEVAGVGYKGAQVAQGAADLYLVPFSFGAKWDVCAIDALVTAAGGRVTDARGIPINYRSARLDNDGGLLASNGPLHDLVVRRLSKVFA